MTSGLDDKEVCVVGIGTRLSRDDAIGLRLVEGLMSEKEFADRCVLLESADAATITSFLLETPQSIVLVDCANMGLAPGECRFFGKQDAAVTIHSDSVSTHGMGLAEGLALAEALGFQETVRIFAVQPFDLSPNTDLTPEMTARFDFLLETLKISLREWMQDGIPDRRRADVH